MNKKQYFGIRYPFSNDNVEELYIDLNETYTDKIKSDVLHVLFTPKGQKLRNPDFGTDLIKYIFEQKDDIAFSDIKATIMSDVCKYVKSIEFDDIRILRDENDEHHIIVVVEYSVVIGNKKEKTQVAIKL